jgi:hypothetical protein
MLSHSIILDIETLSRRPDALVTEIGAIAFNRSDFVETSCLLLHPDFFGQLAIGRHVCPETIAFHRDNKTLPSPVGDMPLKDTVHHLRTFIRNHRPERVWIQGQDFDRPIIESLCRSVGEDLPWEYYRTADSRTAWNLAFPGQKHDKRPHHAVPDCRATLKDLARSLIHLNRRESA